MSEKDPAESIRFKRRADLTAPRNDERDPAAADFLLGDWRNTNPKTRGFTRVVIERAGTSMTLQVFGTGDEGPVDWGVIDGEVFANVEEDGVPTSALYGFYDLGYMEVQMQIRANKGVLVITHFARFKDDSGRSNWVDREFFCRRVGLEAEVRCFA
jgi:hypothetical protein